MSDAGAAAAHGPGAGRGPAEAHLPDAALDPERDGPPALVFTAAGVTLGAPHVRDTLDLRRALRAIAVALVPSTAMALYNTGHQAGAALAAAGRPGAGGWRVALLPALGLGPAPDDPLACVVLGLLWVAPVLAVAYATARAWELAFARARRRAPAHAALVTALVLTLCLPPGVPLALVLLGTSFGVVLGKEVFGGTGYNFVHPAIAGLVFLYFAYPAVLSGEAAWSPVEGVVLATPLGEAVRGGLPAVRELGLGWSDALVGRVPGPLGAGSALAAALGGLLLLATRLASWRIVAGGLLGLAAAALIARALDDGGRPMAGLPWHWHLVLGTSTFGLVFLATDPATSATTDVGRWIHGVLFGALVVLIRVGNPVHDDGVVLAVLLGSVCAPLIDATVAWAHVRRRAERHG